MYLSFTKYKGSLYLFTASYPQEVSTIQSLAAHKINTEVTTFCWIVTKDYSAAKCYY